MTSILHYAALHKKGEEIDTQILDKDLKQLCLALSYWEKYLVYWIYKYNPAYTIKHQ